MLQRLSQNLVTSFTSARWRGALLVAVVSDALGFGVVLLPPVQWLLDAATAAVLFAILGFRWPLLPALAVEAIPGLELFPAWTLVVLALAGTDSFGPRPPRQRLPPRFERPGDCGRISSMGFDDARAPPSIGWTAGLRVVRDGR